MITKPDRKLTREKRHMRIRSRLAGSSERPRLCVYRSNKHIYAQIVDDSTAKTLAFAGTLDPELKGKLPKTWDREAPRAWGSSLPNAPKIKASKASSSIAAATFITVASRQSQKRHAKLV